MGKLDNLNILGNKTFGDSKRKLIKIRRILKKLGVIVKEEYKKTEYKEAHYNITGTIEMPHYTRKYQIASSRYFKLERQKNRYARHMRQSVRKYKKQLVA